MIASPLRLEWYFIKELHVVWQPEFDASESVALAVSDLSVEVLPSQNEQDPLKWAFEVSVALADKTGKRFPYTFQVTLVGFFELAKAYSDRNPDSAELLARVNGPAVLYSAAREHITTVTSRGPCPEIILPTVTFLPVGEEEKGASELLESKRVIQAEPKAAKKRAKQRSSQKK